MSLCGIICTCPCFNTLHLCYCQQQGMGFSFFFILRREKKCAFRAGCWLLTHENTERFLEDVFVCEYNNDFQSIQTKVVKNWTYFPLSIQKSKH
jgi:hypothetical protein